MFNIITAIKNWIVEYKLQENKELLSSEIQRICNIRDVKPYIYEKENEYRVAINIFGIYSGESLEVYIPFNEDVDKAWESMNDLINKIYEQREILFEEKKANGGRRFPPLYGWNE